MKGEETEAQASGVVFIPYDQAYAVGFEDMVRRIPDISKLNRLTGWVPRRSLDEILKGVVNQEMKNLERGIDTMDG
jgi:UDP-glucose 4-epimerase